MITTTIPFHGFFLSCHNAQIDDALDHCCDTSSGDIISKIRERLWNEVNWSDIHEKYACLYTSLWADIFCYYTKQKITFEFDALTSPREYNFETDRIFAKLSEADAKKLYKLVDRNILADVAKERFTTRSGFISFYSPRLAEWPADVAEWDHNQIGSILIALCKQYEVPDDPDLIEDIDCNCAITNIVYESLTDEGKRLVKIADYLRGREERAFRLIRKAV